MEWSAIIEIAPKKSATSAVKKRNWNAFISVGYPNAILLWKMKEVIAFASVLCINNNLNFALFATKYAQVHKVVVCLKFDELIKMFYSKILM